jgi:acyl carrier protein
MLKAQLPEFMVPSAFVRLNALPQTPNGKLDRQALPAPSQLVAQRHSEPHTEPQNNIEQLLTAIWKEVLNLNQLSTQDNFFDLGGHSLLAVQVLGKLRQATDRDVSITDIFRFPTVASLARHLAREEPEVTSATQGFKRAQGRRLAWSRATASTVLDAGA